MKSTSIFGDVRLDRVQDDLINAMSSRLSVIINQLSDSRSELMRYHRFLENEKVTPQNIIEAFHRSNSVNYSGKHLLMIQDTSDMSLGFHANRSGLGYIGGKTQGFRLHPCITLDADNGSCYNVACAEMHYTDYDQTMARIAKGGPRKDCRKIPFEQKQSFRWYSAAQTAIANSPGATTYTVVADREADIYQAICGIKEQGWDFLIRSNCNRLIETTNGQSLKLREQINRWQVKFDYQIHVGKTKKRTAHLAKLKVKFGKLNILKPQYIRDKSLAVKQEVYVIEVRECSSTVVGKQKPIDWVLLTSHPIKTEEEARYFIRCYCLRWVIEQVFRTLKSKGLDMENSQLESDEKLEKQTVLALIAAVQVLQLVQARDGQTNQQIQSVFTEDEIECLKLLNTQLEGNTEKQKNPYPREDLAFACWVIARLGGWKGYKGKARPPGPITFKNGLVRFYNIMEGYYLRL